MFTEYKVIGIQELIIKPLLIVAHDWKKLRLIFKALITEYKICLTRFTQSGTHNSDFFNFCNGKLEIFYFRKWLELRPEVIGYVEAELPEETFADSSSSPNTISAFTRRLKDDVSMSTKNTRHRAKATDHMERLVIAVQDSNNNNVQDELARSRMSFMAKEYKLREESEKRKGRDATMNEWERLGQNISRVCEELGNKELDNNTQKELQQDLEGLQKQKHIVGNTLRFNTL